MIADLRRWWRTRRCHRHGHDWPVEPLLRWHCHRVCCRRCQRWAERHACIYFDEVSGEGCAHVGADGRSMACTTSWVTP